MFGGDTGQSLGGQRNNVNLLIGQRLAHQAENLRQLFLGCEGLIDQLRIAQVARSEVVAVVPLDPLSQLGVEGGSPEHALVQGCGIFARKEHAQPQASRAATIVHALSQIDKPDLVDWAGLLQEPRQRLGCSRIGLALSGTEQCHFAVGPKQYLTVEQITADGILQWQKARGKLDQLQWLTSQRDKLPSDLRENQGLVNICLFVDQQQPPAAHGNHVVVKYSRIDSSGMLLQIKRAICRQLMSSGNRLTSFQRLSCGKLLWLSAGPLSAIRVKGNPTVRKQLQSRTVPSRRQPGVIGGSFIG